MVDFNQHLDQIFTEFSKPEYSELMTKAKDSFVDFAGSFDEDNLDIEMKWSQFRDWFLFSYSAPYQILAQDSFQAKVEVPKNIMDSILTSQSSVFQHIKSYKDQLKIRDLISRNKYYVFDENVQLILEKNDYFQTRIFNLDNKHYFSGSYVIHPPTARKFIDSKIKIIKKEKDKAKKPELQFKFLDSFFKMYYRALRFRQVEIQKIYSDLPLFERKSQVTL